MDVLHLVLSYPDFKLNEIINPEEFDINNGEVVAKVNEIIDLVNEKFGAEIIPYPDNSVITSKIAPLAITSDKIADSNILTSKIADNAITTSKILDANVTTTKIADSSVVTSKIANANVTSEKLANGCVITDKLGQNVVTNFNLANDSVASNNIAMFSVKTNHIYTKSITNDKLADACVTVDKIDPNLYATLTNVYTKAQSDTLLSQKVDKAFRTGSTTVYKVLSDNNYSDAEKHANKSVIDGITSTDINNWNGGNVLTKNNVNPYTPTAPYHPATMKYVQDTVVAIGTADMQKSVYDPTNKATDIFQYADNTRIMTDESTGKKYILGVDANGLYYKEVL